MDDVAAWFLWLYKTTGIKLTIFYDAYDRARFVEGFVTTVKLSAYCLVLSLALGALRRDGSHGSRIAVVRAAVNGFVQLFRNTPPLVQLYFFYFALGPLLPKVGGVPLLGSFGWAVVSLTLLETAFAAEIYRAGIEAVPKAMVEAARVARLLARADLPQGRAAARAAGDDAGDDQQSRQPREDDHARLRDRGAGARLHVGAGLVRAGQRARDDDRASRLLRRASSASSTSSCSGSKCACACRGSDNERPRTRSPMRAADARAGLSPRPVGRRRPVERRASCSARAGIALLRVFVASLVAGAGAGAGRASRRSSRS